MFVKLIWFASENILLKLGDYINETYCPSPAYSLYLINEEKQLWNACVYFPENDNDFTDKQLFISQICKKFNLPQPQSEKLQQDDWVKLSLQGLGIVETQLFVIHGSHDKTEKNLYKNKIPILIDANQAFGTGHHATTVGCIKQLENLYLDKKQFSNIWDLGCGSAILSIVCDKLWSAKIIASDIDELSVNLANENCLSNKAKSINCIVADGLCNEDIIQRKSFDLIIANILYEPLSNLVSDIYHSLAKEGCFILSGILNYQMNKTISLYQENGFILLNKNNNFHPSWPTLLFGKK